MINLNAVIIQFHFQCARMTMNNVSTSGSLTDEELSAFSYEKTVKAKVVSIDLKIL